MKKIFSLIILVSLVFNSSLSIARVFAEENSSTNIELSTPKNSKTLEKNEDGTYNITLSVTGEEKTEATANKANVVIIFDRSGSMNTCLEYYPAPYENYCLKSRKSEAIRATNSLLSDLFRHNETVEGTVEVAMIMFSKEVEVYRDFSDEEFYLPSYVFSDGGTNWEGALKKAYELISEKNDGDENYIIFVTDGNPTHYLDVDSETGEEIVEGSGFEDDQTIEDSLERAKVHAKKITDAEVKLYNLGIYGSVSRMETLTEFANSNEKNLAEYYKVDDVSLLVSIFSKIVSEITKSIMLTDIKILDGITEFTDVVEVPDELEYDEEKKVITWNLGDEIIGDGEEREVSFSVKPSEGVLELVSNLVNEKVEWDESFIEKGLIRTFENDEYKYFLKTNRDFPELSYRVLTMIITDEEFLEEKSELLKVEMENPEPILLAAERIIEEPAEEEPTEELETLDESIIEDSGRGEVVLEEEPVSSEKNPNTNDSVLADFITFLVAATGLILSLVYNRLHVEKF